jgi:hypothetical protein
MARPKAWIGQVERIQRAVAELEASQPLGSRDIELLFGVGRSAAHDLMRVIGSLPGAIVTARFGGLDDLLRTAGDR